MRIYLLRCEGNPAYMVLLALAALLASMAPPALLVREVVGALAIDLMGFRRFGSWMRVIAGSHPSSCPWLHSDEVDDDILPGGIVSIGSPSKKLRSRVLDPAIYMKALTDSKILA